MRAPRATGSCYRSQVRRADKQTMTTPPPSVCVRVPPALHRPPKTEICQWLTEIVGIPGIPPDPKQPVTRQEGERRPASFSASVIHFGMSAGAIFHKIKGPCVWRNTLVFAAAVRGEYLEAAVGRAKRLFAL